VSLSQWVLVLLAGIAGYAGVSWLIDRGRAKDAKSERAAYAAPAVQPSASAVASAPTPSAPAPAASTPSASTPNAPTGERSAWDEFNKR